MAALPFSRFGERWDALYSSAAIAFGGLETVSLTTAHLDTIALNTTITSDQLQGRTMSNSTERVGFIGAGMMGSGMCRNLMSAGYPVSVIANRNRGPIDALVSEGANEASSLAGLADSADVMMICVNSAETVSNLIAELKPHLRSGMLVIDITTSLPDVTRRLAAELEGHGVGLVDAPVVGGPAQSVAGKLGTFLGGKDGDVRRAEPIVGTYSSDVAHFGGPGQGHTVKLLNNFLTVGLRQLVVQSIQAARRNDVDLEKFLRLAQQGAAGSRILEQFGQCA
ncbi:MAG: NAD(P)-dependent oxidoreductase, partial [Pseudomonadota bacterium]